MRQVLRFPEDVREFCARRYRNQHREWLAGGGAWPLEILLGSPTEAEAQEQPDAVRDWVAAWREWRGTGNLVWCERRRWTLGPQSLPERLVLEFPRSVAAWIGEEERWQRAWSRYGQIGSGRPALAQRLARYFDALADCSESDMGRLKALLAWIESNPRSGLYPRQIPLAGMDTKWLEPRMPMIADLAAAGTDDGGDPSFHRSCGLREAPLTVRFRLLDNELRHHLGGLSDITAPIEEIARLKLPLARVYIVENVQTGLCFGDRPGSVVFLGLGYGVSCLSRLPWVTAAECIYWGDIDTHGFAILNRARAALPRVVSVLMDELTLLRTRDLWVEEKSPYTAELPLLTTPELEVYQGLRQHRWGPNVRLEQERIAWSDACQTLGLPAAGGLVKPAAQICDRTF